MIRYRLDQLEEEMEEHRQTISSATKWLIGTAMMLAGNLIMMVKDLFIRASEHTNK